MGRLRQAMSSPPSSLGTVVAAFGLGFLLAGVLRSRTLLADGYMTLYSGRAIAEGGIPSVDPFTVEGAGRAWINQQWLAHLAYYRLYELGGYPLVGIASAGLVASGFAILAWLLHRLGSPSTRCLIWTSLALAVAAAGFIIRAQSFAYPLFATALALIVIVGFSGRFRWMAVVLIPLLVLWANLHGSALLGTAMIMTWCIVNALVAIRGARIRHAAAFAALLAVAPLCLLVTPFGLDVIAYYRSILFNPVISAFITEWQPAAFGSLTSIPIFIFASIVLFVYAWSRGRGIRPEFGLAPMTAVLVIAALSSVRYQAWMGMAGAVLVCDLLTKADAARGSGRRLRTLSTRTLVGGGVALSAITALGLATTAEKLFLAEAPHRTIDVVATYATEHPSSDVLADEATSAALLWLHPTMNGRIAFDPRLELYAQRDLGRWVGFVLAISPRWRERLDGYDVVAAFGGSDTSAIRSGHPRLVAELARLAKDSDDWRILHEDDEGIVIVRTNRT